MTSLLTSDIHLDDSVRDSYRWDLLPWLKKEAQRLDADNLIILGDFTVAKDRHSAGLVNRFADQLFQLSKDVSVYLLKANHDYLDAQYPFFQFTRYMDRVHFISSPTLESLRIGGKKTDCLFLPSVADPRDWGSLQPADYIFTHQTYDGALAENGSKLESSRFSTRMFKGLNAKVYSGDIHVPQTLAHGVEYVGAPYRVHFGDTYTPRVIYIDKRDIAIDFRFPCPTKHLIVMRSILDLVKQLRSVRKGDQVKVRCLVKRAEFPEWKRMRALIQAECKDKGVELYGPELVPQLDTGPEVDIVNEIKSARPTTVVKAYAKKHDADEAIVDMGVSILKEVTHEKSN